MGDSQLLFLVDPCVEIIEERGLEVRISQTEALAQGLSFLEHPVLRKRHKGSIKPMSESMDRAQPSFQVWKLRFGDVLNLPACLKEGRRGSQTFYINSTTP